MTTKGKSVGYFHGDAGEWTGTRKTKYGKTLYEIKLIEGHLTGQLKWVARLYIV